MRKMRVREEAVTRKPTLWLLLMLLIPLLIWVIFGVLVFPARSAPPLEQDGPPAASLAASDVNPPPGTTDSLSGLDILENNLERIYTEVNPSVVHIEVVQKNTAVSDLPGFDQFDQQGPGQAQGFYRRGSGSGFVWDQEGHIVTNHHVIEDAEKISVIFPDGTTVDGKPVGTDPDSDLAVLKVEVPANQLFPVQMAESDQVRVGQLAVAIGNPFGLENTMTLGIVSGLGRLLPLESGDSSRSGYSIPDIIQTDAPINPGNSGGVLLSDEGQVIGVTSAIISPNGISAGIGFAIPAQIVNKVVPVLIDVGHYEHPRIGISGASLNPDLARAMGLDPAQRGALVIAVDPDGPAARAGLQGSGRRIQVEGQSLPAGGDLIVAIDGQEVRDFDDVVSYLARNTQVGQVVRLTLLRESGNEVVSLVLTARPQPKEEAANATEGADAWLGIAGQTLASDTGQAMDIQADLKGVLVEQVEPGSPADKAGLRGCHEQVVIDGQSQPAGGDVIVTVDQEPVDDVEGLRTRVEQSSPGDVITLGLLRDGQHTEVEVQLGGRPQFDL